ncbi:leucyl aminopeptidase [Microterricola pindariensis]|uniref:Probable cytosol aminopeptidase n=1 Tax=Microterricola pindariensis TaxID=478010 RepID=A0ABX5ARI4_9MICO|nr:leucyl aminopeptidase [Microterricola pindariensis]PPL14580.1 leucyl aminopeptidase [Microterricola pindariensis]
MTFSPALVSTESALSSEADVLLLAAVSVDGAPVLRAPDEFAELGGALAALGFTGAAEQLVRIPATVGAARSIAVVGLGKTVSADSLRGATAAAVRALTGVETVAIAIATADAAEAAAVLEGAGIGSYSFTEFRSSTLERTKTPAGQITVHLDAEAAELDVESLLGRADVLTEAFALVKDLVNTPPSELFPASFAERAEAAAEGLPVELEIWDEAELAADGFGGILGVGQGSSRPPRLVKVSYSPEPADGGSFKHLALVGKGITFDTGGISLKPGASMVGMKYDMTGAATVLAIALAAAKLALPVRVTAWLCLAENMPSGTATRPNDVLRIRGGQTVEVLNTDAEGRLVMADGLAAASEEQPDAIVDVATLTGAQIVALGSRYSAVMGDDALLARVLQAASAADEKIWPMPLPEELRATIDSDVADIANAKIGNPAGGMLLAGVFLQEFVGMQADGETRIPWAHLDIAGSSHNEGAAYGATGAGPTGVTLRTLLNLAEDYARP